jgi:type II secretory pathway component GspD/PulD (secretin)
MEMKMKRLLALALVSTLLSTANAAAADTISLNFSGPLPRLITALGEACGTNMVADPALGQKTATISLRNVTCDSALDTIEHTYHIAAHTTATGVLYLSPSTAADQTFSVSIPLINASAVVAAPYMARAVTGLGTIVPDSRNNALVYVGDPAGEPIFRRLVSQFDTPATNGGAIEQVHVRYALASAVAKFVVAGLGEGSPVTIVPDDSTNGLLLSGPPGLMSRAIALVNQFDVPGKLVDVRVTVYDLTPTNDQTNVGFQFGSPQSVSSSSSTTGSTGSSSTTGSVSGTNSFTPNTFQIGFPLKTIAVMGQLNTLISRGNAKLLASPNTLVHVGQEGNILIGETYPSVFQTAGQFGGTVTVQTVNAGIILKVTPLFVGADGAVELQIHAEYSQITGFVQTYPILSNDSVDTVLDARSGDQLTFGGLTVDNESKTVSKLPLIGDIPVLGRLLSNTQTTDNKEQVVFQITPVVEDVTSEGAKN